MQTGHRQVVVGVVLLSLTSTLGAAPFQGRYTQQLARECDALVQGAIRRPYGWGWDNIFPAATASRATPRHVTMEPLGTPAAGLLLLWSGKLLEDPKYQQAALETGRGIAASQTSNGKIPLHVIFGSTAAGRDEPAAIAERAATSAGLAFLLALNEAISEKPETTVRAQQRASLWLMRQQQPDGGWPSAIPLVPVNRGVLRFVRLDTSDCRDSTYALLLAASIAAADDRQMSIAATKAVQKLMSLRMGTQSAAPTTNETDVEPQMVRDTPVTGTGPTGPVWSTAYHLTGQLSPPLESFPAGIDVPASKYAMETLLAAYLLTGDKSVGPALDAAARTLNDIRRVDGTWLKLYPREPATQPTTQSVFQAPPPAPPSGEYELDGTLRAIDQLKQLGRDRYLALLGEQFSPRHHLAAAVCGLLENPLTLEFPASRVEITAYLEKHRAAFAALDGPVPDDLSPRLKRLWTLFIRATLEQRQNR